MYVLTFYTNSENNVYSVHTFSFSFSLSIETNVLKYRSALGRILMHNNVISFELFRFSSWIAWLQAISPMLQKTKISIYAQHAQHSHNVRQWQKGEEAACRSAIKMLICTHLSGKWKFVPMTVSLFIRLFSPTHTKK